MKFVFVKSKKKTSGRRKVSIVFSPYNIRDFDFPLWKSPAKWSNASGMPGDGWGGGGGRMLKVLIYRRIIL